MLKNDKSNHSYETTAFESGEEKLNKMSIEY